MELTNIISKKPLESVAEKRFGSPRVIHADKESLQTALLKLISGVYFKCRFSITSEELALMSGLFMAEIRENYKWITAWEIDFAFSQGYKNRYGDYMGLSVKTFCNWLDSFEKIDRQLEMEKRRPKENNLQLPSISESEKENLILQGLESCFNYAKEYNSIQPGRIYLYDYLDEKGLMPTDIETKNAVLKIAKKNVQKQADLAISKEEKNLYSIENIVGGPSNKVVAECKRLSLLSFFNQHALFEQIKGKL